MSTIPLQISPDNIANNAYSDVKFEAYKRAYELYFNLIKNSETSPPQDPEKFIDTETKKMLFNLPKEEEERIVSFVTLTLTYIPDDVLNKNPVINATTISSIYSAIFNVMNTQGLSIDKDMFVRIIYGSKITNLDIGTPNSKDIPTVHDSIEDLLRNDEDGNKYDGWAPKDALANTLIKILIASMPFKLSTYGRERNPRLEEKEIKFKQFNELLKSEFEKYMNTLEKLCTKYYPGRQIRKSEVQLPVFIEAINGIPPLSNDPKAKEMESYIKGSPGAITSGNDMFTGLPLTLTRLTFGWEDAKEPDVDQGPIKKNYVYEKARVLIHEDIHTQGPELPRGRLNVELNEMLTDTLAQYVQMVTYDKDFLSDDFYNFEISTGYFRYVRFAREMIKKGVIDEATFFKFAIDQNPQGLIDHIQEFCRDIDNAKIFVKLLQVSDFILPIRSEEVTEVATELSSNTQQFFEQQFMKAVETLGKELPMYRGGFLEFFSNSDPEYFELMRQKYANLQNKPLEEINANSLYLLYDSDTGVYDDRVVDLIRQYLSTRRLVRDSWRLKHVNFLAFITDIDGTRKRLFKANPFDGNLNLDSLTNDEISTYAFSVLNLIERRMDLAVIPKDQIELTNNLLKVVEKLFYTFDKLILDYLPNSPLESRKKINLSLIKELVPEIIAQNGFKTFEDFILEICSKVSIILKSGNHSNYSIAQTIYYGKGIGISQKDLNEERANIESIFQQI